MTDERLLTTTRVDEDVQYEAGLRPRSLDEYIGQERIRENLHVSITAARQRGEAPFDDRPVNMSAWTSVFVRVTCWTSRRALVRCP